MSFQQTFETSVNAAMREGEAGPAPRSPRSPIPPHTDADIKKRPRSLNATSIYEEAEDLDLSSKGEKTLPPRFSTLFGPSSKAAPPPPPTPRLVECCHRESGKKKAGIYLSTPVFILLVLVLLFESTLLFAYTVIGLYQHLLPTGLLSIGGAPPPLVDGCACEGRQGAINFAPNFVFGEEGKSLLGLQISGIEGMTTATPTSTTAVPTTSTTSNSSEAAAAASQLLSLFDDDKSTTKSVAIVTETPGLVQSTIIVTSVAGSSSTESAPQSTVTSIKVVDGPATTIQAR